ncbi:hypothetical protein PUR59_01530 [Streptomyces sp. SP18ES09]|uniref:hypothetical protein n=1 Tax=Streptomyces sp. SP18ES09 TaxID=3002532 RepID=UPI002E76B4DE|nr:hypothetical protein [Streptomyces sp. SP18ES09]MEE1813722.1 hypothetical protein [Streptomyces sp. SP18ES09]
MSQTVQHRIDVSINRIRDGLDDLLREIKPGLDAADQRHLLHRLYDSVDGGVLLSLGEVITAASITVSECQPNHEGTIEALDEAAAYVADSAGQRIDTARNLLTRPAEQDWPTPEQAYANAPSIVSEIGWTARTARLVVGQPFHAEATREFWLRKAALLDRISLDDHTARTTIDAAELANEAARRLMDLDNADVICHPRHYVRQQYARHTADQ